MKQLSFLTVLLFIGCLVVSCTKSDVETPTNNQDVYTCGYGFNGATTVAKVWKNGVETALTNGAKNAKALSMVVVGSDVYVAGFEEDNATGLEVATYWKNGTKILLGDPTKNASNATSITVVGTDVYVAGFDKYELGKTVAKYWKNGVAKLLGSKYSSANAIAVVGGIAYIGGSIPESILPDGSPFIKRATVWEDGGNPLIYKITNLSDKISEVKALTVVGTDVYAAGTESRITTLSDTKFKLRQSAKVWKIDSDPIFLTDPFSNSEALGISLVGTDVYVSGYETADPITGKFSVGKIWKNGKEFTALTDPLKNGKIIAIRKIKGDVFAVGNEESSSNAFVSKVWKNNSATIVMSNSVFTDLFVTEGK